MRHRLPVVAVVLSVSLLLSSCTSFFGSYDSSYSTINYTSPTGGYSSSCFLCFTTSGYHWYYNMAWVDGSLLVLVPLSGEGENTGQEAFWITSAPVTRHQHSLCVQGGDCQPLPGETAGIVGPDIVGPDDGGGYCEWMGGRAPTAEETAAFARLAVKASPEGASLPDGVYCVVDNPRPRPMYAQTSPFYDPVMPLEDMHAQPTGSETYCKNGTAYQILSLEIPEFHSIDSVEGEDGTSCQQVDANRVVCGGVPNSSPQVEVGLLCDGFEAIFCQPASELGATGCSNNMSEVAGMQDLHQDLAGADAAGIQDDTVRDFAGMQDFHMDDWELDANGALVPSNGHELPAGGLAGTITRPLNLINGVMVARSMVDEGQADDSGAGSGSVGYEAAGRGAVPAAACPVGFYLDGQGCTSLGPSEPACLHGFTFDESSRTCKADTAEGSYPGCPLGQILDPSTGVCDPHTNWVSATQLHHAQTFQLKLPDCTDESSGKQNDEACVKDGYTKCP